MNENNGRAFFSREHMFAAAFFIALIFILYQAARLIAPFSSALLWGAVIALSLYPVNKRVLALVRGKKGAAAGIMTALTFILVIGPATGVLVAMASQVADLYHRTAAFIQTGEWQRVWDGIKASGLGSLLTHPAFANIDIKNMVLKGLGEISSAIAGQAGNILRNTLMFIINFFIMLFSLFFIFRDGESYYTRLMDVLPFSHDFKMSVTRRLADTFYAVINGIFFVAILQGFMTGLGFALFGVPFAVFWGVCAAFFALLPVGGAALVWGSGAVYLFLSGETLNGVLLIVWGMLLVSLPDNFLKPLLIGKKARLPTFFLFLGILGGLKVYGLLGILIGPLIVTLLTAFLQIYQEEYMNKSAI